MSKIILSQAPARICLFGDHQDYLQLPVIACAIDRKIQIKAEVNDRNCFFIHKINMNESVTLPLSTDKITITKTDYLQTALRVLSRHGCIPNRGYDVKIKGDIPINAGLSSSSALTIAWIQFLIEAYGIEEEVTPDLIALLAYETEVLEHNTSGGKMDQFTIALGNMIYLNTFNNNYTTFSNPIGQLVIGVSGIAKDTFSSLSYLKENSLKAIGQVKQKLISFEISKALISDLEYYLTFVTLDLAPFLRAAITNHHLTKLAKLELEKTNPSLISLGKLMNLHHDQLQNNLKITTPKIDDMIQAALDAGAYGAKIVGSGGGGCIVALIDQNNTKDIIESLKSAGVVDAFSVVQSKGSKSKKTIL